MKVGKSLALSSATVSVLSAMLIADVPAATAAPFYVYCKANRSIKAKPTYDSATLYKCGGGELLYLYCHKYGDPVGGSTLWYYVKRPGKDLAGYIPISGLVQPPKATLPC